MRARHRNKVSRKPRRRERRSASPAWQNPVGSAAADNGRQASSGLQLTGQVTASAPSRGEAIAVTSASGGCYSPWRSESTLSCDCFQWMRKEVRLWNIYTPLGCCSTTPLDVEDSLGRQGCPRLSVQLCAMRGQRERRNGSATLNSTQNLR